MGDAAVGGAHVHRVRVRYAEVDMQRVVYNAHYLTYCDDAMDTWLRQVGALALEPDGYDVMLKRATIEWKSGATVGDILDIAVGITRWGRTSFDAGFVGKVADRPVFTATVTYVGVRAGTTEPVPPPPDLRAALGGPASG